MEIYIEVVIILICLLIILIWSIWKKRSNKKFLKHYSVDNDKSKNGEIRQRKLREDEQRLAAKSANPIRPTQPKGRGVLPRATTNSSRESSSGLRGFFKGRRKEKRK